MAAALIVLFLVGVAIIAGVEVWSGRSASSQVQRLIRRGDWSQAKSRIDASEQAFRGALDRLGGIDDEAVRREMAFEVHRRLGAVALMRDDFKAADGHLAKAVESAGDLLSPQSPDAIGVLGNQAIVHLELGRDAAADALFARLLEYEPLDYPAELRTAASLLQEVAMACLVRDLYRWPVALLKRALCLHDQLPKPVPKLRAAIVRSAASAHMSLGEFHLAGEWLQEFEEGRLAISSGKLLLRGCLAVLNCDCTAAEQDLWQHLSMCRSQFGAAGDQTAGAWGALALLRLAQGRLHEARDFADVALQMRASCLGASHARLAHDLLTAAICCTELGDAKAAEAHLDRGLSLAEMHRRRANANAGSLWLIRGLLERDRERFGRAEAACRRARSIAEGVFGHGHRQTAQSLLVLSEIVAVQGRNDEARVLLGEARAIWEHCPGVCPPDMIDLYSVAARTHFTIGELSAAGRDLEQAVALIDRHLDRTHHWYGKALHTLAALQHAEGRTDEAVLHFRQAIDLQLRIRLPTHPGLARLFEDYGACLAETGLEEDASIYRARALSIRAAHRP